MIIQRRMADSHPSLLYRKLLVTWKGDWYETDSF